MGFVKTMADRNLYYLFGRFDLLVLVLYVDDIIGTFEKLIARCKIELPCEIDMKKIDLMHYFLGLKVW